MSNILAIDLGERRIGLASGSTEARLARPLEVIIHKSRKEDIEAINRIVTRENITRVIIGISYHEDGQPNSMGRHAISFGTAFESATGVPVDYHDEALSTQDAKIQALENGIHMKARRGHLDASSAAIILQSFFDNLTNTTDM